MKGAKSRIGRKLSPKFVLEAGFEKLEDNFPKIANILNYHSKGRVLETEDFVEVIYRDHKLLNPAYSPHFKTLTEILPNFDIESHKDIRIPIKSGFVEDAIIYGHIKAPIRISNGMAFGFAFPKQERLPWGDVYPLPLQRARRLKGDIIFIPRLINIFHLMIEHILPPFAFVVRNKGKIEFNRKFTFVTQVKFPVLNVFADYLNYIGFDCSVVELAPYDKIYADRVIMSRAVSDDGDLNYAYSEELAELSSFLNDKTSHIQVPEICYIKRTDTPRRNILNQNQFVAELSKEGIQSFDFNFGNYMQQIAIFSKSKTIISGHGAALTNIMWSNDKQKIVELFSKERRPKCMLNIASQHNLAYHPLIGSSETGNGHFKFNIRETIKYIKNL